MGANAIFPSFLTDWLYTASPSTQQSVIDGLDPIASATDSLYDGVSSVGDGISSLDPIASLKSAASSAEPWVIAGGLLVALLLVVLLIHELREL